MAATTKMDANNREDILPRNGATKNLSLKGEGRPRSPASSAAPNCGSDDGGRPVESRRGGEGDGAHKKGRRRPRAKGSLPRKGGGPASRVGSDDEDGGDEGAAAFAPAPAGRPMTPTEPWAPIRLASMAAARARRRVNDPEDCRRWGSFLPLSSASVFGVIVSSPRPRGRHRCQPNWRPWRRRGHWAARGRQSERRRAVVSTVFVIAAAA